MDLIELADEFNLSLKNCFCCFGIENFDMRKNQLTRQGFMELNLMEATEKDGDPADLWVTLEAMGYNRMLELLEVSWHIWFECSGFGSTYLNEPSFCFVRHVHSR